MNFSACALAGQPKIPSPEMVENWAQYDRRVNLVSLKQFASIGYWRKWGKPLWIAAYTSERETLTSFVLALYEAGSFSAINKGKLEELRTASKEFSRRFPMPQYAENPFGGTEKLPDGREIVTFTDSFGPGGSLLISFAQSADGRYDIVLGRQVDGQGDRPVEQRLSNPAEAKARLQDMFIKFDTYIRNP